MSRVVPAWSLRADATEAIALPAVWPDRPTREWAFGDSTGQGIRVCILDSGVDREHRAVAPLASAVAIEADGDGEPRVVEDEVGDVCGHGTACAGVVRGLAPDCELHSIRVLGAGATGSGDLILAGLRHAIEEGYDVVNMSLSTTKRKFAEALHELADGAYFRRTVLVAAAHNMPVESFPWRFSSVISVGSHEDADAWTWYANPTPPVEFFARGVDVEVAWPGGVTMRCTGNSFAAPHIAGMCALALAKHPELTAAQLKSLLYLTATNTGGT
jgi:subtilisin family serine protease